MPCAGDRRALARLLTAIENRTAMAEQALRRLYPRAGRAHLVGITGPPGAGKIDPRGGAHRRGPEPPVGRSRSSPSTRRARSPAARSSATASGCRPTPAIATSSSARWPLAATPVGWPPRRPRRRPCSTRPASIWSSSRRSGPARARSRSPQQPTRRSSSRRPRWATRSRRSRPGCSRWPTSSSSTRATARARSERPASCGRCCPWRRPTDPADGRGHARSVPRCC